MSAPSTYRNNPYDGRHDVELPDAVEVFMPETQGWLPPGRSSSSFAARYAGQCVACASKISPGDVVTYGLDDQLEHVECPDPLEIPVQGICTGCWLTLPVSGVCGVCE